MPIPSLLASPCRAGIRPWPRSGCSLPGSSGARAAPRRNPPRRARAECGLCRATASQSTPTTAAFPRGISFPGGEGAARSAPTDRRISRADTAALQKRKRLATRRVCKPLFYWWPRAELNHRHKDFQSSALPTELLGHLNCNGRSIQLPAPAGNVIIPAASGVAPTGTVGPGVRGQDSPSRARYCPKNAVSSARVASGNSSAR